MRRWELSSHTASFGLSHDDCSGMPAARRALLLEPFGRLEAAHSRDTGDAGLRLAIMRADRRYGGGPPAPCQEAGAAHRQPGYAQ